MKWFKIYSLAMPALMLATALLGPSPNTAQAAPPLNTSLQSLTSDFNGTKLVAGNKIWFSSVVKVNSSVSLPTRINMRNAILTFVGAGGTQVFGIPDGSLQLVPTNTTSATGYVAAQDTWYSTSSASLGGNYFIAGATVPITAAIAKGVKTVTWTAEFTADQPLKLNWQWAAAVYTNFSSNYSALGVKPVDDNKASTYKNSDHAGTPENYKTYVIGGARGGGGSNYTGSYSGTASFSPPPCGCGEGSPS